MSKLKRCARQSFIQHSDNTMSTVDTDTQLCGVCNEKCERRAAYACDQGHTFCQTCFDQEYYPDKEQRCPHLTCNSWLKNVQEMLEQGDGLTSTSNKLFPNPEMYSKMKRFQSQHNISSQNYAVSQEPLRCPYRDCQKRVSINNLDYHFRFEHPHVAFVHTKLETRNGLELFLGDIYLNQILCLVVFKLLDEGHAVKVSPAKSLHSIPGTDVQPVFIAMACKVSEFHSSLAPSTPQENLRGCRCHPGTQKILLWVGSSIATKLSYTIAVSTQSNDLRMKYYGPVLTIGNNCKELCTGGKGLVLTHYHIIGMSKNNAKVVVDIVIHEPHEVASE